MHESTSVALTSLGTEPLHADPPIGPVAMIPLGRVLEFVEANPGCTHKSTAAALLGATSKRRLKTERPRAARALKMLAFAGMIERRAESDDPHCSYTYWPIGCDHEFQIDWRVRARNAETQRNAAEAEAKRWRDRCSVTHADADAVWPGVDVIDIYSQVVAWCSRAGVDPMVAFDLSRDSCGPHDLVNRIAASVRRPPFDVLAEILDTEVQP